jgi:hypothetical protein
MSPEEPFVLGAQLAAAGEREAEHRRTHSGESPLQDVSYREDEFRLWRWVDAPADSSVARFVERYRALTADDRTTTRARLRQQDFYTLIMFAKRTALAAVRTGDGALVPSAYDALSAIELDRVDWRDVSWAAAVVGHAAQRLGRPVGTLTAGPASRAHPDTAALLTDLAGQRIDLARSWGLCEVDLGDGPVFLDAEHVPRTSDVGLAGKAVVLADAFEADRYTVTGVTVDRDIPAIWLNGHQPGGMLGCASVSAHLRDSSEPPMKRDTLLAFVVRTRTPAQAAAIAAAANAGSESSTTRFTLTATEDRLCVLLFARSVVMGRRSVEDHASLMRFDHRLRALVAP